MSRKRSLLFIILCIVFTFFFSACSIGKNSPQKQVVKCYLEFEPTTLDPQVCTDFCSKIVVENLYEGLVSVDETGKVVPKVAKSFESNSSFTEYTFHLRKDVYWSGKEKKPVTARDFVFAIKRILKDETNASDAHLFYCIKNAKNYNDPSFRVDTLGVKAVDDYTLKFILDYPVKEFPKLLALPAAMPCNEDFFNSCAGQYGMDGNNIFGNGPFRLKRNGGWDHFNKINLIRNENYRGVEQVIPQGVTFIVGKKNDNVLDFLKNETVDIAVVSKDQKNEMEKSKMQTFETSRKLLFGLFFNLKNSVGRNLNFRRAVISSLDRDHILKALTQEKDLKRVDDFFDGKILPNGEKLTYYTGRADYKSFCSEQPFSYLRAFIEEEKIKRFSGVTILCENTGISKAIASSIIENLNNKLNYHFNMQPLPRKDLLARVNSEDYVVAIAPLEYENEFALDFFKIFSKKSGVSGPVKIEDTCYEEYLDIAAKAGAKKSIEAFVCARNYFLENAIACPLYEEPFFYVFPKKINNLGFNYFNGAVSFKVAEKTK